MNYRQENTKSCYIPPEIYWPSVELARRTDKSWARLVRRLLFEAVLADLGQVGPDGQTAVFTDLPGDFKTLADAKQAGKGRRGISLGLR